MSQFPVLFGILLDVVARLGNDTTPKSLPCFRSTAKQHVGIRDALLESCYGDQSAERKLGFGKSVFFWEKVCSQQILQSPRIGKQQKTNNPIMFARYFNARTSAPTPVLLTSREETQTMVREKLAPKPRPPQTSYLPGKGETQTMV